MLVSSEEAGYRRTGGDDRKRHPPQEIQGLYLRLRLGPEHKGQSPRIGGWCLALLKGHRQLQLLCISNGSV